MSSLFDEILQDSLAYIDPEIAVTFCLTGKEVDLNEISERLDLIPDKSKTPDDSTEAIKNPKTELPDYLEPCYLWEYTVPYEVCNDVSVRFEEMLMILKDKENNINDLKEKFKLEVSFTVGIQAHHDPGNMPAVYLTEEIIAFAASIGADIGFDMY